MDKLKAYKRGTPRVSLILPSSCIFLIARNDEMCER